MAYTFLELQNEVLAYGFDSTMYRARVQRWLNEAQHAAIRRVPTRDNQSSGFWTLAAGNNQISLPTGFVRVDSIVRTDDHSPIHPVSAEWADTLTPATGGPSLYWMEFAGIFVYPTPDQPYTLFMRYVRDPAEMVNDADVPTIPPAHQDILISYAAARAYRAEDDQERAGAFMGDFERGLVELAADRRHENGDGPSQVEGMWVGRHGTSSGFRS